MSSPIDKDPKVSQRWFRWWNWLSCCIYLALDLATIIKLDSDLINHMHRWHCFNLVDFIGVLSRNRVTQPMNLLTYFWRGRCHSWLNIFRNRCRECHLPILNFTRTVLKYFNILLFLKLLNIHVCSNSKHPYLFCLRLLFLWFLF